MAIVDSEESDAPPHHPEVKRVLHLCDEAVSGEVAGGVRPLSRGRPEFLWPQTVERVTCVKRREAVWKGESLGYTKVQEEGIRGAWASTFLGHAGRQRGPSARASLEGKNVPIKDFHGHKRDFLRTAVVPGPCRRRGAIHRRFQRSIACPRESR